MSLFLECLYALLASFGFAIFFEIKRPVCLAMASLIGGIGWGVYYLTRNLMAEPMSYLLATIAITILCEISARIFKAPSTVFLFPGIIPLVPGGGLYYTMSYLIAGDYQMFLTKGVQTVSLAGAIAVGVCVVTAAARMIYMGRARAVKK